ncbi:uncharacterized protein LOC133707473 isoform X3 [Rosa rugosa]|uniref:uncharacterized protein LOC133707473 isoform X3 n=1 Tax=Rosa rugosa TaxID=74645 RepID=UPI002B4135A3|nr:uncharacterized protein LOC133707473 isoform X3 [Rosa rugosa]
MVIIEDGDTSGEVHHYMTNWKFLLDLHRTWHFQLQGLYKMVVLLPTTTCTMAERILAELLAAPSLQLAMTMVHL